MDLVEYREDVFDDIGAGYRERAAQLGIPHVTCIPLSALKGDNMLERSAATPWYGGEALLQHLETVKVEQGGQGTGFRMPVQWVCRPDHAFRGFAGTVVAGGLAPGDAIAVLPSEAGRASGRERRCQLGYFSVVAYSLKKKK